ncbi:MAG: F0F1 ATP synthase subunit B [bacterium]|nr:F0F1 ATP synthase subunit B [bacterium]
MFVLIAQASEKAAEVAASGGIGAIGIDLRSLVFQIINFAILLLVLKKFAYKPILDVLEKRHKKIEESLKNAKDIEHLKTSLEKEKETILKDAHLKARGILEQSKKQAVEILATAEQKSAERDNQLLTATNAKIVHEAEQVRKSLFSEAALFISQATERVLNRKLDSSADHNIIKEAIAETNITENRA